MYHSGKIFPFSDGLSCAFRQWHSDSHCHFMHGYALQIELEFETETLDARNWVMDFGDFKPVKDWLKQTFDHTTLVASDDPYLGNMRQLHGYGVIDLRVVPAVGCEKFAQLVFEHVEAWLQTMPDVAGRVRLTKAIVREHERNWAAYSNG